MTNTSQLDYLQVSEELSNRGYVKMGQPLNKQAMHCRFSYHPAFKNRTPHHSTGHYPNIIGTLSIYRHGVVLISYLLHHLDS